MPKVAREQRNANKSLGSRSNGPNRGGAKSMHTISQFEDEYASRVRPPEAAKVVASNVLGAGERCSKPPHFPREKSMHTAEVITGKRGLIILARFEAILATKTS